MLDYYVRRPITLVLDPEPLIVERDMTVGALTERVSHDKPTALTSGFIITDQVALVMRASAPRST